MKRANEGTCAAFGNPCLKDESGLFIISDIDAGGIDSDVAGHQRGKDASPIAP